MREKRTIISRSNYIFLKMSLYFTPPDNHPSAIDVDDDDDGVDDGWRFLECSVQTNQAKIPFLKLSPHLCTQVVMLGDS